MAFSFSIAAWADDFARFGAVGGAENAVALELIDDAGGARLADGPRVVTFTASATGFASGSASLVLTDNEASSNIAISGRITTARTAGSLPVGGVTLTLKAGARILDNVVSARNGSYSFRGLPRGTYQIVAGKSGVTFAPKARTATLLTSGLSGLDFVATLHPQILGAVLRRNVDGTLSGLAGVTVTAQQGTKSFQARTDRNGNFKFDRMPLSTFVVAPNLVGVSFSPSSRSVRLNAGNAIASRLIFNAISVAPRREIEPRAEETSAPLSPIVLSSATAEMATDVITLHFGGALDAESASDAARYIIEVNGEAQSVEAASCSGDAVTLSLPQSTLMTGQGVSVAWNGLRDACGRIVSGQSTLMVR